MINKLGVMQGRLVPPEEKKIQSFPHKNWTKEFYKAKKLNIRYIEWTIDSKNFYKNPLFSDSKLLKINYLKKKFNIEIKTATADFFMQKPFWKSNYSKNLLNDLNNFIFRCARVNIKYIVIPLVDNSSLNRISNKKKIINTLKGFENILIRNKMKFLFELDLSPSLARKFIKNFSKRAFGINYDTGNSASYGYAVKDEFSSYAKYIENIHIKDRKLNGFSVPLGQGDVNFSEFFKILKKYKYDNLLILQTARSNKNRDFNEIKRNLTFLKKKFK